MKLEINTYRVLEAASKFPESKEGLKTLFPEVFNQSDFEKKLENFLNYEISLEDFKRIPGSNANEKACYIIRCITWQ